MGAAIKIQKQTQLVINTMDSNRRIIDLISNTNKHVMRFKGVTSCVSVSVPIDFPSSICMYVCVCSARIRSPLYLEPSPSPLISTTCLYLNNMSFSLLLCGRII